MHTLPSVKLLAQILVNSASILVDADIMNRVAVFVDAGYLFAQGSKELYDEESPINRDDLKPAPSAVTKKLKKICRRYYGA